MYGYIYKITNTLNNKVYVGKRVSSIFNEKYWGSGKAIKNSINKYGLENFTRDILEWCNSDDELNEREKFWIKELKTNQKKYGYNFTDGGTGGNTLKYLSEEDKIARLEKIAETKANYSDEQKEELHNKLSKSSSAALKKLYDNGYENNNKGRKWYTNGTEDKMCFECPEGYWLGRSHNNINYDKVKEKMTGRKTYNNGINEGLFIEGEQPAGWVVGRLPNIGKKTGKANTGKHIYNNGINQIMAFKCPEGYVPGKLQENIDKGVTTRKLIGNYKWSEESKLKQSEIIKEMWNNPTYREKNILAHKRKNGK